MLGFSQDYSKRGVNFSGTLPDNELFNIESELYTKLASLLAESFVKQHKETLDAYFKSDEFQNDLKKRVVEKLSDSIVNTMMVSVELPSGGNLAVF